MKKLYTKIILFWMIQLSMPLVIFSQGWICGSPMTDSRDGKTYNTVLIGNQCWMQQNLNYGTRINGRIDQSKNSIFEKYCYDDLDTNCSIYGGLYQWGELVDYYKGASNTSIWSPSPSGNLQGLCPPEWLIPTDNDWCVLTSHLDSTVNCSGSGTLGTNAGGKLKEKGTNLWLYPNTGASNESYYFGLPAGGRATNGSFSGKTTATGFWTMSETSSSTGYSWGLAYNNSRVSRSNSNKAQGLSVRCFMNCPAPSSPTPGTHSSGTSQIIWHWNSVTDAIGYKWATTNDYASAIDVGTNTSYSESGLTCNTSYIRFVWAYTSCNHSNVTILSDTTSMNPPDSPVAGNSFTTETQIIWKWFPVPGATGYYWSKFTNYDASTDNIGLDTSIVETGLNPNTSYTRYLWAYNGNCGASSPTTLSMQTTDSLTCPISNPFCVVANTDFSSFIPGISGQSRVVSDTVCRWNNHVTVDEFPDGLSFNFNNHTILFDPDPNTIGTDSMQIFQELPVCLITGKIYEIKCNFQCNSSMLNFYICLTNDDVSHKFFPFNHQKILKYYDTLSFDYPNPSGLYSLDSLIKIDSSYKYIVVGSESAHGEVVLSNISLCLPFQIDAGNNTNICTGDSIKLGSSPTAYGGAPPYYYFWSRYKCFNSDSVFSTNSNPLVKPINTTWYYLFVIDSLGGRLADHAVDSVLITVSDLHCPKWPRLISSFGEGFQLSCSPTGEVLTSFYFCCYSLNLVKDTSFTVPPGYDNIFILFDKHANRLWFKALNTYYAPTFEQEIVDNHKNTYILFYGPFGYSFYNGPSKTLNDMSQFLAKIDIHGNVNWVQSFTDGTNYSFINSFFEIGDSIYLAGNTTHGNIITAESTPQQQTWPVNKQQGDFICRVKKSNGNVETVNSFYNSTSNALNYITALHDTILVINNGVFNLFSLDLNLLSQQSVFASPNNLGWINNGMGKIVEYYPACAQDRNGSFTSLWAASPPQQPYTYNYSGFSTSSSLYMDYTENDTSRFTKWDLATGNRLFIPDKLAPYYSCITGNNDLSFGYNMSYSMYYNLDTIKIDTFGLPNGIPKCMAIIFDTSNQQKTINNDPTNDEIYLYPNPTLNLVTLHVDTRTMNSIISIDIMNSEGVKLKTIVGDTNIANYKIDLREYLNGVYYCVIKSSSKIVTKKLIKLDSE
jgi:uncharacterized protein (TIGR02145 family)